MTRQLFLTIAVLVVSFLTFEVTQIDLLLQDQLYNFESASWLIDRDNPVFKFLFYDGIKAFYILFIISLIITLSFYRKRKLVKPRVRGLVIVLASTIIIPISVNMLKATTNVSCPKDLARYGGTYPYVAVLGTYPESFVQKRAARCYPAGHASGGFALLSLFFLFKRTRSRVIAVVSGLTVGWSLGLYKMFIGDHFLGHTVMTMMLSWLIILLIDTALHTPPKIATEPNPALT